VGRRRELTLLRRLLKDAVAGRGSLVLVTGESGIGKTRLLEQFETQIERRSVNVVWGFCHADPDAPPFWPWQQIIARHADRREDAPLLAELGAGALDIVPLVPKLALRFPEYAQRPPGDPPQARLRVFERVSEFLRNASAERPLVLVLDDLQWIDDASRALLEQVARDCRRSRLLIVACRRLTDFGDADRRSEGSLYGEEIALKGFGRTEVGRLTESVAGRAASRELAESLRVITHGNPLFVEQLVRFIDRHDAWNERDPTRLGLPDEIRAAVRGRLAPLPDRVREMLRLAAVAGPKVSIDVLAKVAEQDAKQVLDVLQDPISVDILKEVPGSPREYFFTHTLIRESLYEDVSAIEKTQVHRKVAEALVELSGNIIDEHLPSIAHHYVQSLRIGDPLPAVEYCTRAGDHAAKNFAYEESVNQYRRALLALGLHGQNQEKRCDLMVRLGHAQRRAGQTVQAAATFDEACALARSTSNPELLGQAALGLAGEWNTRPGIPDVNMLETLGDAAERLREHNPSLRARVLARRVHEHWFLLPRNERAAVLDEALVLARSSGDPNAIAHVLHIRHLALWDHFDLPTRLSTALHIVSLRGRIDKELVIEGYSWLIADELEQGNLAGWEAARLAHSELANEVRQPNHVGLARVRRAMSDLMKGDLNEAGSALERGIPQSSEYLILFWTFLEFLIHRERGELAEVEGRIRGLASAVSTWPIMRYWLAYVLGETGAADAWLAFDPIAANDFADAPDDLTRLLALAFCAETSVAVGRIEHSRHLYPLLLPLSGRQIQFGNGIGYYDSVAHMLARLAHQLGDWECAETHFGEALRQAQALGAVLRTAHIRFNWAVMLEKNHGSTDTRVLTLLEAAAATARQFRLAGLLAKIDACSMGPRPDAKSGELLDRNHGSKPTPPATPLTGHEERAVFRCEGEFWTLEFGEETARVRDARGLRSIGLLLRHPNQHVHALELASSKNANIFRDSSAGPILDSEARNQYRRRLHELAQELAEAEAHHDPPRAERARRESELITGQLLSALSLGGRSRRAAAEAERARINVTRSIRSAIDRIARHCPGLAHHLNTSIRTGAFCSYVPDPTRRIDWDL